MLVLAKNEIYRDTTYTYYRSFSICFIVIFLGSFKSLLPIGL